MSCLMRCYKTHQQKKKWLRGRKPTLSQSQNLKKTPEPEISEDENQDEPGEGDIETMEINTPARGQKDKKLVERGRYQEK